MVENAISATKLCIIHYVFLTMYYTLRILKYVLYTLRTCVLFHGLCSLSSYFKFEKFSKIPIEFPLIWYILGLCRPNTDRNFLVWQKQSTLYMIPDYYCILAKFGQGKQNLVHIGRLKLTASAPCQLHLPQQWAKFC